MTGKHAGFGAQPTATVSWRIYDRLRGEWVRLRCHMTEEVCRSYAERVPDRYALVRVDAVETLTEVPLG